MSINEDNYKDLKEDERFKKEIKKLRNIFKDISEEQKKLVNRLIENAGFMAILLIDLQEDIKLNGYKDKYQNGENQFGYKRSISADLYQVTIKNYSSAIKQLSDLLPKDVDVEVDDFEEFVNSRNK